MEGGAIAGLVIGVFFAFLFTLIYCCKGICIVNHSQVMIIERFGRYSRTLTPGFHWIWPYIEAPRRINWRHLEMGWGKSVPTTRHLITPYIDMREHVLDFHRRDVITKDTVQISIDALIYFRITDPRSAVYRVENLPDAIEMLTQSTLRNIVAGLTLDETFSSREYVNDRLLQQIEKDCTRWGVLVTRIAIEDIRPPSDNDIRTAMESQIQEERARRSKVISADGNRESAIIRSRGDAAKAVLQAEGLKVGDIARARGEASARLKIAEAEAARFEILQEALKGKYRAADYMSAVEYLNAFKDNAQGADVRLMPQQLLNNLNNIPISATVKA